MHTREDERDTISEAARLADGDEMPAGPDAGDRQEIDL
jgi:hypothetical protein